MAKRHVNCLLELVWKPKLFAKYFVKLDIRYLTLSLEIETDPKFVEDSNFGHKLLTVRLSNFKELETMIITSMPMVTNLHVFQNIMDIGRM